MKKIDVWKRKMAKEQRKRERRKQILFNMSMSKYWSKDHYKK